MSENIVEVFNYPKISLVLIKGDWNESDIETFIKTADELLTKKNNVIINLHVRFHWWT